MIDFAEYAGAVMTALGMGTVLGWVALMFRSSYRRGQRL